MKPTAGDSSQESPWLVEGLFGDAEYPKHCQAIYILYACPIRLGFQGNTFCIQPGAQAPRALPARNTHKYSAARFLQYQCKYHRYKNVKIKHDYVIWKGSVHCSSVSINCQQLIRHFNLFLMNDICVSFFLLFSYKESWQVFILPRSKKKKAPE